MRRQHTSAWLALLGAIGAHRALGLTNQCGDVQWTPSSIEYARNEQEIVAIVRASADLNHTVKVVGDRHSFSPLAATDGVTLDLTYYNNIVNIDVEQQEITVEAGTKLWQITEALETHGFTLANIGTQCTQTIAGAIATSTHGTGAGLPSMSSLVKAMRMVLASGKVVNLSRTQNPLLFAAARASWGALGIISTVTLSVIPTFRLERIVAGPYTHEQAMNFYLPKLRAAFDRVSWTYYPYPQSPEDTIFIVYAPVPSTAPVTGCWNNGGGNHAPWTPAPDSFGTGGVWPGTGTTACIDSSARALLLQGTTEEGCPQAWGVAMEMAVPAEQDVNLVTQLIFWQEQRAAKYDPNLGYIAQTDVRYVAEDDILLSPYFGRASVVVSTGMKGDYATGRLPDPTQSNLFLGGLQNLAQALGGRPHPGKVHMFSAADLRQAFASSYCTFVGLILRVDPDGVFMTQYLTSLFQQELCSQEELALPGFVLDYGDGVTQSPNATASEQPSPLPHASPSGASNHNGDPGNSNDPANLRTTQSLASSTVIAVGVGGAVAVVAIGGVIAAVVVQRRRATAEAARVRSREGVSTAVARNRSAAEGAASSTAVNAGDVESGVMSPSLRRRFPTSARAAEPPPPALSHRGLPDAEVASPQHASAAAGASELYSPASRRRHVGGV